MNLFNSFQFEDTSREKNKTGLFVRFIFFRLVDIKVIASIEYQVIIDKYRVEKKSCANQSMTRKSMQSIHSEPLCSEAYCCCSMSIEWIIVLSFQRHVHCECSLSLCLNGSCGVCHFSSACVTMTLPPPLPLLLSLTVPVCLHWG